MSGSIGENRVLNNQTITFYGEIEDIDQLAEKESGEDIVISDAIPSLEDVKFNTQVPHEKTCCEQACPLFTISYYICYLVDFICLILMLLLKMYYPK